LVKRGDGGQLQTMEAITAAIIMLSIIALVIEATSVTPLTSSFTNQHVKLELQNIGTDILTSMDETPATSSPPIDSTKFPSQLKKSVTDWLNQTGGRDWFACSNTKDYVSLLNPGDPNAAPPIPGNTPINTYLSKMLSLVLLNKLSIANNVDVRYSDVDGTIKSTKMIWNGDPSDNSVTVSRIITLHEEDLLDGSYIIPDIDGTQSDLYNVVEVRLTMWVM
jgi:hypothetical protein